MSDFTPFASTFGGALIGLSAAMLLLLLGRVAGITAVVGTALFTPKAGDGWAPAFIGGLLAGGGLLVSLQPELVTYTLERSTPALIVAGLLVGVGTRLGGGCTSGHGVCGNARMSPRSMLATGVFMATGMLAAGLIHHFAGGII